MIFFLDLDEAHMTSSGVLFARHGISRNATTTEISGQDISLAFIGNQLLFK